jgi:hypothetical protein
MLGELRVVGGIKETSHPCIMNLYTIVVSFRRDYLLGVSIIIECDVSVLLFLKSYLSK